MTAAPRVHPVGPSRGDDGGRSVVLVHGLEDDCRTWRALAATLDPSWRLRAMCMPWRAGNDYRWRFARTPGAWLAEGLAGLPERPTVLIGHSFGANAVLELVATSSTPPAAAAVLIAPFYRAPHAEVTWRTFERSRRVFERHLGDGVRVRLGGRRSAPETDIVETMIDRANERLGPTAFLATFEQYVASGHLPLSNVDIPVLVVTGQGDPGLTGDHLADLTRRMSRCTVQVDAEYDHFCHLRQAARFGRTLDGFVNAEVPVADGRPHARRTV